MPSARELLEQADALMRRNRGAMSPLRPTAPLASPGAGIAYPAPAAPSTAAPPPPPRTPHGEDDFPVLTDAVPPPAEAPAATPESESAAAPASSTAVAPMDLDDVPLLTDAVEEIEAPSVLELPEDDSVMAGEDLAPQRARAPSAVAPDLPASEGELTREVMHPQVYDAPPIEPLERPPVEALEAQPKEPFEAQPFEAEPVEAEPVEAFDASGLDVSGTAGGDVCDTSDTPLAEAFAIDRGGPAEPAVAEPVARDSTGEFVTADDLPLEHDAVPAAHASDDEVVAEAPFAAAARPSPPPPDHEAEQRRWQEMAEEIRMQVLQRIDLFTDTGLRDQLAQRLQPIVDRAAADLVATINQHVGVILRTYVSEAIEREIERWRREGR